MGRPLDGLGVRAASVNMKHKPGHFGLDQLGPHTTPVVRKKALTCHFLLCEGFDRCTVLEWDGLFATGHLGDERRRHLKVLRKLGRTAPLG